jgi:hypothetical protein
MRNVLVASSALEFFWRISCRDLSDRYRPTISRAAAPPFRG